MPDTFCADLVRFAHEAGVPAVVDAVGAALLAAASAGADVVKPTSAELSLTTGVTAPIAGARILLEHGAGLALVSLGADGMLAVTPEKALHARLPQPLEGNPTGAGDAAVAAVAVHLAQGDEDLIAMLERATAWSAAAVLRPLAGEIADDAAELQHLVTTTDA
jgi:fructose-1-phosphate kinase PfkB-like protein